MVDTRKPLEGIVSFITAFVIIGAFRSLLPSVFDVWYGQDTSGWSEATVVLWDAAPVIILATIFWAMIALALGKL